MDRYTVNNTETPIVNSDITVDGRSVFVNTKLASSSDADKKSATSEKDRENLFRGEVTKFGDLTFQCADGESRVLEDVGQGPAKLASEEELKKDEVGFTNPNLHRRIDPAERDLPETEPREYKLTIQSVNSYRTTQIITHDEDNTERQWYYDEEGELVDLSEIP